MKKLFLILILQFLYCFIYGLNVTIIESQSFDPGHTMDVKWSSIVTSMGHTPAILPQTALDNTAFFATTDILIVSSGVITLPANSVNTILQFLQTGKPVYLQSEYLSSYSSNQAFASIVNSFGGTFTWNSTISGDLNPMIVMGSFAINNNIIASLPYFWWSVSGTGDCNTVNILQYGGEYHGFQYFPVNPSYGTIMTTTDQDWINDNSVQAIALMENFITHIINPAFSSTGIQVNIGNDTTLCQGGSFLLDATTTGATYLWQDASTNATFNVTQPGTYWVQVTANGCSGADTIIVNYLTSSTVIFGNDTTLCQGETFTLDATTANATYLWQDNSTNPTFTVTQQGTYWVQVTVNNCNNTDTINIGYNPLPTANAGSGGDECDLTFNLNAISGVGTGTWSVISGGTVNSWSPGPNAPNAIVTVNAYGTYQFEWELDNNGCTDADTIVVNFYEQPVANAGVNDTVCDLDVVLQATPSVGTGTWTLINGAGSVTSWGIGINSPATTVTVDATGSYIFSWTEVNASICTSTDYVTVIFAQPPVINFLSSNESCYNSCDGSITASVTGVGLSFEWGTNPIQITQTIGNLCAGTYFVTVTDQYTCQSISSYTLLPREPIVIDDYTYTEPSCYGNTDGSVSVNPSGGTGVGTFTYQWNDTLHQTTQNAVNLPAGDYAVTITDANSCTLVFFVPLDEPEQILISVNQPGTLCNGQSANLAVNPQYGTQPYAYEWTTFPPLIVISTEQSVEITPTTNTTYYVQVTDANLCTSEKISVIVYVLGPLTLDLVCENPYVCPGDTALITVFPGGGTGGPYFIYQKVGPEQYIVGTTLNFIPDDDTTIVIALYDGCTQPVYDSVDLFVYDPPPITLTATPMAHCQPATIQFYAHTTTQGLIYLWDFGDDSESNISMMQNPQHDYEDHGEFNVTLQVTTPEGCVFNYPDEPLVITIFRTPLAVFEAYDDEATRVEPVVYFTNLSLLPADDFIWDFGDGSGSDEMHPQHEYPDDPKEWLVTLITINPDRPECRDTVKHIVEVAEIFTFYAPSAFVPDGVSSENKFFRVYGHGIDYDHFHLLIYDRWGEIVFETFNFGHGWDGTAKNGRKQAPNGVYTWLVTFRDTQQNQHQKSGAVTLIR